MAFFRACCRQSASTLDSPSSKERPSASAIAAMFPNDAAAICPPKMRLTVGMDTPLRDAKLWNPIPSIFRRVCSRSAVIGRIFLMVFSYHIRYILEIKPKALFYCQRIYIRNPALKQISTNFLWSEWCALGNWDNPTHLRKREMIDWIGKRNEDHWQFTSPRAKNICAMPLQRIGAGKQARVVWKFRKHLPVIWVIASAVGEIFFQMR